MYLNFYLDLKLKEMYFLLIYEGCAENNQKVGIKFLLIAMNSSNSTCVSESFSVKKLKSILVE